jgi:hypothetical protein
MTGSLLFWDAGYLCGLSFNQVKSDINNIVFTRDLFDTIGKQRGGALSIANQDGDNLCSANSLPPPVSLFPRFSGAPTAGYLAPCSP